MGLLRGLRSRKPIGPGWMKPQGQRWDKQHEEGPQVAAEHMGASELERSPALSPGAPRLIPLSLLP